RSLRWWWRGRRRLWWNARALGALRCAVRSHRARRRLTRGQRRGDRRQARFRRERNQRQDFGLGPARLQLLSAHVVVLGVGSEGRQKVIDQNLGPQEHDEISLLMVAAAGLEDPADHRDAAEVGHALFTA